MDYNKMLEEWDVFKEDIFKELIPFIEEDEFAVYWWTAIDDCDLTLDGIFNIEQVITLGKIAERIKVKRTEVAKRYNLCLV